MTFQVLPRPVDTTDDRDDDNHVACSTLDRTWCGQDARELISLPDPLPPLESFCRVCLLAVEMHVYGAPCPICGTRECLS